ncbi:DL-endopeptidase inhibitor IseA family protein [Paenibacillus dendritiformis]|uniref:DL-endopeptidase inhibitor IseA family protein n=1 Tax=Paenibacillus dendritiformis TaxID=130049 RepID=UPI000A02D920|nr:DL-endopeptidase inhibitor IseA family protein [Paenibacillus dendritiformis]CAH8770415.1 hypothetical protein H7S4_003150 [Paenibacillus dendritiformis]
MKILLIILISSLQMLLIGNNTTIAVNELTKEEAVRLTIEGENQLSSIIVFSQLDPTKAIHTRCGGIESHDHYYSYICDAKTLTDITNKLTPYFTQNYIDEIIQQFNIHNDKEGVLIELFDGGYTSKSTDSIQEVTIQQSGNKAKVKLHYRVALEGVIKDGFPILDFEQTSQGWRVASNGLIFW